MIGRKVFWFRLFGYGLSFEIDKKTTFSERIGHKRVLRFRSFSLEWLRP